MTENGVDTVLSGPVHKDGARGSVSPLRLSPPAIPKGTHSIGDSHDGGDAHSRQLIVYKEDPVFIKVIGMIPQAMFWVVAQPIARYANNAFDAMLQKLTGLALDEPDVSM